MALPESLSIIKRGLDEVSSKLKSGFHQICCKLDSISDDFEYVPVYDYADVQAPSLSANSSDDLYYIVSGTSLAIAFKAINLANFCGDYSSIEDSIINVKYEDTLGHSIESANSVSTSFINLVDKDFMATVTISLNSGFIYSFKMNIITNGSGEPTVVESYPLYSNSNASSQKLWVNTLAFQKPVQDLLEVWRNGVFVEYIKVEDHSAATVRYCLSYDPVQPFRTFDHETLAPIYNTPEVVSVNSATVNIEANTAHSVSYLVTQGTPTLIIDGVSVTLSLGAYNTFTGTALINKQIRFTCTAAQTVVLTIMKP